MKDKLYVILAFSAIPIGGTATLPHGLTLNGQALVPDFVAPQYPGTFEVTATMTTGVTLHNVSSTSGDCLVWCNVIHPVARSFGVLPDDGSINEHLTPQPFVLGSPVIPSGAFDTFNVKNFGALGNGVHDDTAAINLTIAAAAATVNGAFGAMVEFPKGVYLVSSTLVIPNGVGFLGEGPSSSVILAAPTFNAASLIRNQNQDGTQEFAYLQGVGIDGNQGNGAVCSTSVVDLVGLFVTSFVWNVLIRNGSNVGLHVAAAGTPGGTGPVVFGNVWCLSNVGDNVLAEEMAGNAGAGNGLLFINLVTEHQGTNKAALHLKGLGQVGGWAFYNVHIEMGGSATGRTGIILDGVSFVLLDGVQLLTGGGVVAGITITTNAANVGIQIRSVTNNNLINPVLQDLKNLVTVGALNLPVYCTPDVALRGQRFIPDNGKSLVAEDTAGTERAWFDDRGSITGASFNGSGLDVVADLVNNRPLTMADNNADPTLRRVIGFVYPDASNFRLQNFFDGVNLLNFDNAGNTFIYNPVTIQFLLTLQSALKGPGTRAAAPSTGTHGQGEIILNADPVAAGFIGWVCVAGGSPGTWKSWGLISP